MRININVTRTGFLDTNGTNPFLFDGRQFKPGLYISPPFGQHICTWLLVKKGTTEAPMSYTYVQQGDRPATYTKEEILAHISATNPEDEATLDRLRACLAALALFTQGSYTTLDG